jgi:SOS-response transcriptional repressor LexA
MSVILCAIFILIFTGCIWLAYSKNRERKTMLPKVEAGPVSEAKNKSCATPTFTYHDRCYAGDKILNPSKYYALPVEGKCMSARNICENDVIMARKFNAGFRKSDIKPDDILLIRIDDDRYRNYKYGYLNSTMQTTAANSKPFITIPTAVNIRRLKKT